MTLKDAIERALEIMDQPSYGDQDIKLDNYYEARMFLESLLNQKEKAND